MEPTGSWVFLGGGVGALFRSFGGKGVGEWADDGG